MTTGTHYDRSHQVAGVAIFFLALSTVTLSLRCYCRLAVVKNFGWDDFFAVCAWLLFVFYSAFCLTGTVYGTGRDINDIPPENVPIGLKWWWACEPVYVLSNMALKMSIGLFLLRIVVEPVHKYLIWLVLVITEIFGAVFFFLFIFQCSPTSYFWNQFANNGAVGKCLDTAVIVNAMYAYSAISCWGDWTLSIVPIFIIRKLQMTPRTKLVVVGILALGGIASTATIVRIPYVHHLHNINNFLYSTTDVAIWSTAETGIGIAACCVATLRPLLRTFLARTRLFGSTGTPPSGGLTGGTPHHRSNGGPSRSGFVRSHSKSNTGIEQIGLRSDVGKNNGVHTIIESNYTNATTDFDLKGGKKDKWKNSMWNNTSESRLADDSSSEEVDPTTDGPWTTSSTPPESGRSREFRIEVNTAVVQSSAITVPERTRSKTKRGEKDSFDHDLEQFTEPLSPRYPPKR